MNNDVKIFKSLYNKQCQLYFELDFLILNISWIVYAFTVFVKKKSDCHQSTYRHRNIQAWISEVIWLVHIAYSDL